MSGKRKEILSAALNDFCFGIIRDAVFIGVKKLESGRVNSGVFF